MTSPEIPASAIEGMRQGRYSILLGAGFSVSSRNRRGDQLPTAWDLAKRLAKSFSLSEDYGLAQLADAIDEGDLNKFLQEELRGCTASAGAKTIASFIWRTI